MNDHRHSCGELMIVSRLGGDEQMVVTFPNSSSVIVAFDA